ncbi:MAG: methyl-accepting chemotaxis protein [Spirochaetaceae bacterium]|nr:methyl-accepting chemotaxis protein [Spirochaetaceae bacterium]
MKLKFKLTLIITCLMVLVVAVISLVLLTRSVNHQIDEAYQSMELAAGMYAKDLQGRYGVYYGTIKALAEIMNSYESVLVENRRRQFTNAMRGIMESNPYFVGMYSVWKPGVLDDRAVELANTPGTDHTGNFIPFFSRASGTLQLEAYKDFQTILAGLSTVPTVSNPTPRLIGNRSTLTMNITYPIIADSTHVPVGVIGIIVDLAVTQNIIAAITPYEGEGELIVLAPDGVIAAHGEHTDQIGKRFQSAFVEHGTLSSVDIPAFEAALKDGKPVLVRNKETITQGYPILIGDTKTPWMMVADVEIKVVLGTAYSLIAFAGSFGFVAFIATVILVYFTVNYAVKPIVAISLTLKDISEGEGDLTKTIILKSKDEIGDLGAYFNLTLSKIKDLVLVIKSQSGTLSDIGYKLSSNMTETAAAINEITATIQSIKTRIINQSASVTETGATIEQIALNINRLNEHIDRQSESVTKSSSAIEQMLANIQAVTQTLIKNTGNVKILVESSGAGRTGLQGVAADIQEIAKESAGLLEINKVMENIAAQTNLLSMNAAIEAAHAGEAGKGFAVVAGEIRKLAESSSKQSKTIAEVLSKIKNSIDKITQSTEEVLNKFEAIDSGVRLVMNQEEQVRNAMEEQGIGSKQILEAIAELNEITSTVKHGSEEMLTGSQEIAKESRNLEHATQEIANGMSEMALGADQINIAIHDVNGISRQNKETIDALVSEVSRFKVE